MERHKNTSEDPNNSLKRPQKGLQAVDNRHVQEWLENIQNKHTRRAYRADLSDFMEFKKMTTPDQFKSVERMDMIAWRDFLTKHGVSIRTIKRKMCAVSKFMDFLCDIKILAINTSIGVQRPKLIANQGETPIASDFQVKRLLETPPTDTIKGLRDRAILATLFYHALRRSEAASLKVRDVFESEGVKKFRVFGKGSKIREVPINLGAVRTIFKYLEAAGHKNQSNSPLFCPVSNRTKNQRNKHLDPHSIYEIVLYYVGKLEEEFPKGFGAHGARAQAITNALKNGKDLNEVREWAGHANIATTALYDKREHPPEDSPSHSVRY